MPDTPHSALVLPNMHPSLGFSLVRGGGATGSAAATIEADRTDAYVVLHPAGTWAGDDVVDQIDSSAWTAFGILSRRFGSTSAPTAGLFTIPDNNADMFVVFNADGQRFIAATTTNSGEFIRIGNTSYANFQTRLLHGSTGYIQIDNGTLDARMSINGSALRLNTETDVAPMVTNMTTTQRDALTPQDGMILYNTTAALFQVREAGAWRTM